MVRYTGQIKYKDLQRNDSYAVKKSTLYFSIYRRSLIKASNNYTS